LTIPNSFIKKTN